MKHEDEYNGYPNYMTFRIMSDHCGSLILDDNNAHTDRSVETYVRERLFVDISSKQIDANMYNIFDYCMVSLRQVDWQYLADMINTNKL